MTETTQKPRIVDNPAAPELYVNKVIGSSFDGATIGITLGSTRILPERLDTPPGPPAVHLAGRLCLTPAAASELAKAITAMLSAISSGSGKAN